MPRSASTIVLAVTACLLWSTAFPFLKIGLEYNTPLAFAGTRFMLAGLMILPFTCRPSKYIQTIKDNYRVLLLLTLVQSFIHYILFYTGINLVPASVGALINGAQPLIIAVFASYMIRNEPLTLKRSITLVTGLSGVVLVSVGRHALQLGSPLELLGALLVMGSNFTSAFTNVLVSKKANHINPALLSSFSLFIGGTSLYLLSIPVEGITKGPMPSQYWLSLIWLSLLSAIAFNLWYKALQRPGVKVSDLNLWKFIVPVFGAILSWLIIPEEKPDLLIVSGMIIITLSLVLFFYKRPGKKSGRL